MALETDLQGLSNLYDPRQTFGRVFIHTKNVENGSLQFLVLSTTTLSPGWLSHNFPGKVFDLYSKKKCANIML